MSCTCKEIIEVMNKLAPEFLAEEWDNVGLQIGCMNKSVSKILVTLDIYDKLIDEAIEQKVDMIITHHPLIYNPIKNIRNDTYKGIMIDKLIKSNVCVYVSHTNLDAAEKGINAVLADIFELIEPEILVPVFQQKFNKIAVFVPEGYEENIIDAMSRNGGGWIGNYSHCTYKTKGTGTFMPLNGSNPYVGEIGRLESVDEYRIETIVLESDTMKVTEAIILAHPYEEVAYDIYPVANIGKIYGYGRVGMVKGIKTLNDYLGIVKENLQIDSLKYTGELDSPIQKVAVCGGSGAEYIDNAANKEVDLYITGDIKYHDAQHAHALGLNIIDAGHFNTENVVIPVLKDYLFSALKKEGYEIEVIYKKEFQQIINIS